MGGILIKLDLLSSLRGIPWVLHRQAPEHFMVEFWKPRLVPSGLVEQEQASSECFLKRNRVSLREIFAWLRIFLKKKVLLFGCSPRASGYLVQGAWGSFLEIVLILYWKAPEHIPGFFIEKKLGYSLVRLLFVRSPWSSFVLRKSSWWRALFRRKKCTNWV